MERFLPPAAIGGIGREVYLHAGARGFVRYYKVLCFFSPLRNLLWLLPLAVACSGADTVADKGRAANLARAAQKTAQKGDQLQAFLLYSRAAALDPGNTEYQIRRGNLQSAPSFSKTHLEPEETIRLEALLAEDEDLAPPSRTLLPPVSLRPSAGRKSFNLTGDARTIFEKVAGEFGIQVQFEADYQSPSNLRLRIDDASFADAFRALELVSNSFVVPLDQRSALVVRDTPQRRAELAPTMVIIIPIPERMSIQDAQEIVTAVQQTMEIRRVSIDAQRRNVILRDSVPKVTAARHLFSQLSRFRAQVEVEVEVLAVNRNSSLQYGLDLQNSSPLVNFSSFLQNKPSVGSVTRFLAFGGGKTLFGMGIADALAFAMVSRSSSESILKSTLVTLDGQAATLHIGDRFPIITSQYSNGGSSKDQSYLPAPAVTFEDLGLVLKITPSVHSMEEMSLDIEADYKLLGTGSSNGIPVISNRKFQGKVRLRDGEWGVIAGLAQQSAGDTRSGIAGLVDLPWIGRWLRKNSIDKNSAELVLVLKPHLLDLPPWEEPTPSFWTGTESRPLSVY